MAGSQTPEAPVLRIVRGSPDDVEIAALAAVTARLNGTTSEAPPRRPMSAWADRSATLHHPAGRRPLRPGPNAWRASALPG